MNKMAYDIKRTPGFSTLIWAGPVRWKAFQQTVDGGWSSFEDGNGIVNLKLHFGRFG